MQGDMWWDSETGIRYIYYTDANSSQWVQESYPAGGLTNPYAYSFSITDATSSTSTTTGALTISGGVGIGENLNLSGNLTVNGTGAVYLPNRPAFRVTGSGTTNNLTTTQNGDGRLNNNNFTIEYQQGSGLVGSTGVFTAPVAGLYQVNLVVRNSGYAGGISQGAIVKNYAGSSVVQIMVEFAASSSMNHTGGSTICKLAAGDTLVLKVLAGQINFDGNDNWSVAYIG
jgi:hypothetical protein